MSAHRPIGAHVGDDVQTVLVQHPRGGLVQLSVFANAEQTMQETLGEEFLGYEVQNKTKKKDF